MCCQGLSVSTLYSFYLLRFLNKGENTTKAISRLKEEEEEEEKDWNVGLRSDFHGQISFQLCVMIDGTKLYT